VLALIEHHPNADLDTLGLQQLFEMIVALPGFADDPILAHDGLLTGILREWYEEIYDQ
jgi:FeS assembly protein IscX